MREPLDFKGCSLFCIGEVFFDDVELDKPNKKALKILDYMEFSVHKVQGRLDEEIVSGYMLFDMQRKCYYDDVLGLEIPYVAQSIEALLEMIPEAYFEDYEIEL